MNDIIKLRYDKLGPKVVSALEKKKFEAYYFSDCADALEKILTLISPDASVSYGGSMTLNALGIKDALRRRGNMMFDRDLAKDADERKSIEHQAFGADWYLMSSNAISERGQLINIDGFGNRVAALIYGPKNVLIVAGMNKVVKSNEDAMSRARNIAGPGNMMRFPERNIPCGITGACEDCNSDDCGCNQVVITRRSDPPKRIKIVLIGEDLGL